MESKIEINCPECSQGVRIPKGKHIKFICPHCSNEFEYDGRIKKSSYTSTFYLAIYSFLITSLLFIGYNYFFNKSYNERNMEKLVEAVDYKNPVTNDFAVKLASYFPGEFNIGQICKVYDYIVKHWKYVNDAKMDDNFRSASRSIQNNFSGDCDDFAILIAALIESIGGEPRISTASDGNNGHAFTEVYVANTEEQMRMVAKEINNLYGTNQFEISYKKDADGKYWLNLDWFGEPRHPGGKYFDYTNRVIFYPTLEKPYFVTE